MAVVSSLVILLTCIVMQYQAESLDESMRTINFLTNYVGIWTNEAQVNSNQSEHRLVQMRILPARLDALLDVITVFIEWAYDGGMQQMFVATIKEESNNTVIVWPHNFTDPSQYKPGELDVKDLSNLTIADLTTYEDCKATFYLASSKMFAGTFPVCYAMINGTRPAYSVSFDCDTFKVVVPEGAKEAALETPYVFRRIGYRFPVPKAYDWCATDEAVSPLWT